jgi:hypothetical protein
MKPVPAYLDPEQPLRARIADLTARFTLDEKISQLVHDNRGSEGFGPPATLQVGPRSAGVRPASLPYGKCPGLPGPRLP